MSGLLKNKWIKYLLTVVLIYNVFMIRVFAKESDLNNIVLTEEIVQAEVIKPPSSRVVDENRIYYTTTRSSAIEESGVVLYGFTVKYTWSVDGRNPSKTLAIESVKVVKEVKNYKPIGGYRGPKISKGVNNSVGYGTCTVQTTFLHPSGVIDLYQYATLLPQGTANIRTKSGITS